jgi:hypothetical protein
VKSDADFAMAWVEPSVSLPLLAGYVLGRRLSEGRPRLDMTWKGELLERMRVRPAVRASR